MATTIDITSNTSGLYTWDNVPLAWSDDPSALRTWDKSYASIQYVLNIGETIAIEEELSNGISHAEFEQFALIDGYSNLIGLNPVETLAFDEAISKNFAQSIAESFNFSELVSNTVAKTLVDSFGVTDDYAIVFGLNKTESFNVSDAVNFGIYQSLYENFMVADGVTKSVEKNIDETIDFDEVVGKNIGLAKFETVSFMEEYANSVGYIRDFAESFGIADSVSSSYSLQLAESFQMLDAWRRQGDMVLSDMVFAQDDFTIDDFNNFMKFGTTPGYERWRDFVPGDYEYQQAMFRVVLQSANNDRALLRSVNAMVDVPDLIDHGSAYVSNADDGAAVTYGRLFHIIPEITMSVRSGAGANPIVVEFLTLPTKTGFTARLRDTVTNTYVTGSFTWAAHGY